MGRGWAVRHIPVIVSVADAVGMRVRCDARASPIRRGLLRHYFRLVRVCVRVCDARGCCLLPAACCGAQRSPDGKLITLRADAGPHEHAHATQTAEAGVWDRKDRMEGEESAARKQVRDSHLGLPVTRGGHGVRLSADNYGTPTTPIAEHGNSRQGA